MNRNRLLHGVLLALCGANLLRPAVSAEPAAQAPYTYVHHAVSTSVPAAQFAFDRGLTLVFAYEPGEAKQAFREAARLDPSLAMAWWGIALALGPNINFQPDEYNTHAAADAITRAKLLATKRATPLEREYIEALSVRSNTEPKPDFDKLAVAYRDALHALVERHPNDADAAAQYAESIMDLRPWRLWTADGNAAPGTDELVATIERGLRLHPQHIGLLHFYIHAVEASNNPARALLAARRLSAMPMEPAAAHLVHMPAHIYLRTGDWSAAIAANEHSIHHALDYRLSSDPKQQHACGHCVDFLTYAYMMEGDEAQARKSAREYQEISHDPSNTLSVLIRFHEWDDVLTFPEPVAAEKPRDDRNINAVRGYWHFGRGLAFVAKEQTAKAEEELSALRAEALRAPAEPVFGEALDVAHSGDKLAQAGDADSLKIAISILQARLAAAHGQLAQATEFLREAVHVQDTTPYGEPPTWPYPIRESLGALLLKQNASSEAEETFREGLRRSPHNPRLLLGLAEALHAQGRGADAAGARKEFEAAWHSANTAPNVAQL